MPSKTPTFAPLEFKPIDFSLTAGTDIPAPPESPPATPGRPPTGGPLSSHPTSPQETPPLNVPGGFPSSATPSPAPVPSNPIEETLMKKVRTDGANSTATTVTANSTTTNGSTTNATTTPAGATAAAVPAAAPAPTPAPSSIRGRAVSATTVGSTKSKPGSPNGKNPLSPTQTSESTKRPSSVRRFLGFRSASSSDSLRNNKADNSNGNARPASPPSKDSGASRPGIRERRKSNSWFGRRASTMLGLGNLEEGQVLGSESTTSTSRRSGSIATVDELHRRQQPAAAAPEKQGPPPKLPDYMKLGGDFDDGGSLDADNLFKNIN